MNKRPVVLFAVTFCIALAVFAIVMMLDETERKAARNSRDNDNTPSYQPTTLNRQQDCQYVRIPYDAQEYYDEREPYTDQECTREEFSFAVEDFKAERQNKNCNAFGLNCDHYIVCSLDIVNHEREGGSFMVAPKILDSQGREIPTSLKDIRKYVYAQSRESIWWQYIVGKDQQVRCGYVVSEKPKKETCQTVTKYRTVQKTRTITKWKQEYQCE